MPAIRQCLITRARTSACRTHATVKYTFSSLELLRLLSLSLTLTLFRQNSILYASCPTLNDRSLRSVSFGPSQLVVAPSPMPDPRTLCWDGDRRSTIPSGARCQCTRRDTNWRRRPKPLVYLSADRSVYIYSLYINHRLLFKYHCGPIM